MGYRNYGPANGFIVDAASSDADFATIQAAVTAAPANTTILIKPGTYTENITLASGKSLAAWTGDAFTPNVTISGTITVTSATTVSISGIRLQTNSAALLAVTGSAASIVNLINCYLNCTNNTGITFSSSSASSSIKLFNCIMDTTTTGIAHYAASGGGLLQFFYCTLNNSGVSTTPSTQSSTGQVTYSDTNTLLGLNYSSSNTSSGIFFSEFSSGSTNQVMLTTSGLGAISIFGSYFASGNVSAISIGTGTTVSAYNTVISSSNTNAITGAGTLNYSGITFSGSSVTINTTTQVGGLLSGGVTQTPSAGFIGEKFNGVNTGGTGASNNTALNITSITLTAGIWDISGVGQTNFTGLSTVTQLGISKTSATIEGNGADQNITQLYTAGTFTFNTMTIPSFRMTLTAASTPVYLVANQTFSTGTATVFGRISATRVG